MTISSTTRKAGPFDGNGVTTSFPFTFKVFAKSDLRVVRTAPGGVESDLVLDSDYSVALNADQDANPGGTVTYPLSGAPLPAYYKLTLVGGLDYMQPTDITNGGGFYPQVIENSLDRLTMLIQQLGEELDRAVRIAISDDQEGLDLPAAAARADRVLGFDANGNFRVYDRAVATVTTIYRKFTPTEGQTVFTLPQAYPPGANSLYVFLNGAKLVNGADYEESSSLTFTLTVGATAADTVEVIAGVPLASGTVADSSQVSYTPAGAGAVARTAQGKMRESVSVLDFGAVGDGVADDTAAFMSAFAKIKTSGGAIYVPAGVYKVSSTLDFFVTSPRGGRIFGDGHGATWIHWTGGADPLFSNEQGTANQFQYGFMFEDMTLATVAPGASIATPLAGSTGVHAEMLQKLWGMRNVIIVGFETNLDIGVHADGGLFSKCQFGYGDTGVNAYGDQADCLVFHACWFTGNKTRGLILSSPRPVVDSCFFGPALVFSDTANYSDIQIGWQAVRAGDIGKSSYLTAAAGNAAVKAKIINNAFEGDGSAPQIIIKNIDTDTKRFADLVFENNSFASYGRPCAVRIEKAYDAVTFRGNRMSKSAGSTASFLDITSGTMGELVVDERHIADIWPSQEQLWTYGASQDLFDELPVVASSVMYQLAGGSWNVNNEGSAAGITLVDLDFDGQQNIKVTYGSLTGVPGVRIRHPSCPAGWVYVAFGIEQSSGALAVNVDAKNGSGVTLFSRTMLPVSKGKRRVVFGFNNPILQNIDVRIYPRPGTTSGDFVITEPLVKHGDGSAQSQSLVDTKTGMRFTQRLNQIHDWAGRIPFAELADWSNLATGRWFVGSAKQTTINNVGGYSAGATSIIVADGTKVAVDDYLYFKPATASGLSNIHRATATTGNKVNSVSSNTIGLATGLSYAVPDGGSVIACPVYQRAASTKL